MINKVYIYGAGGHGKVIANIFENNSFTILGFIDDDSKRKGSTFFKYPVFSSSDELHQIDSEYSIFIAIGSNAVRKKKFEHYQAIGIPFINAIHPKSILSNDIDLGKGICIMAGVIVNPSVKVKDGAVLNTGCTIDHDCTIDQFVHISPGVNLAGTVHIKENAFIGTGAVVNPGITIGKNTIVGSGSVVIKDLPDNVTAVGNPAKIIKQHS